MDTLGGMTRTGVKVAGPASDLVELENDKGLKHLGITFHRKYRDHEALAASMGEVRAFLEHPDVCDLLELVEVIPENGAFIYPTGTVIPVAQMLEVLAKMGEPGGVKAGLELCYLAAQILQEAYDKGERHGVYSHGDVSPWRMVCKTDGQVQIIGYGLPQVDVQVFRDGGATPKEDAFRYCPPERLEGEEEDFSSDLFSLCLVAFELMVGEPLYNGVVSEIKQQATNAQGPYRLYQHRDRLPEPVVELLSRALKYDIDARHADVNEFIWEVRDLLGLPETEGPTLAEIVSKVKHRLRRRRPLQGGATAAMTPEELAEIADELDGPRKRSLPEPKQARPGEEPEKDDQQRWGRVSRSGGREPRRASGRESGADRLKKRLGRSGGTDKGGKEALKERLRRSRGRDDPPSRKRSRKSADRGADGGSARKSLRRSRQSGADDPSPAKERKGRASSLLARLRSSRGDGEAPADAADAGTSTGRTVTVTLDGGPGHEVPVLDGDAVGDVVWRALARVGGPPVGLTGALEGWYAAEVEGEAIDADQDAEALDGPVVLVLETTRTVIARVEVETDPPTRFQAPVQTAVTAGAVLDHLVRTLDLDGTGWQIAVGGRVLHRLQPLGEVADGPELTVVVSK